MRVLRASFIFVLALLVLPLSADETPQSTGVPLPNAWASWQNLASLPLLDSGTSAGLASSWCRDGCRRDRHSHGEPKFLRTVGDEGVIFEDWGPGLVSRIWVTMGEGISEPLDPSMRIHIIIDQTLAVDMSLPDFFSGSQAPFLFPMTGNREVSSGGNFSLVPLPYQHYCRISLMNARDKRIWFQVNHQRLPADLPIRAFDGAEDLSIWGNLLQNTGISPWTNLAVPIGAGSTALSAGGSTTLLNQTGSDTLFDLLLEVDPAWWHQVHLRVIVDGSERIHLPLVDFFALGQAFATPQRSLFLGFDGVRLYCYFPMPFFHHIQIQLTDPNGALTAPERVVFQIRGAGKPAPPQSGYFTAIQSQLSVSAGEAFPLFDLQGRGKWVGLFAQLGSVTDDLLNYLEGDEAITIDGSIHPGIIGTGVEDFFSGGFYFRDQLGNPEPFQLALHGMRYHRTEMGQSTTAMVRFMVGDAVPFSRSAHAVLEAGPEANIAMRGKTVAYFYLRDPVQPASQPLVEVKAGLDAGDGVLVFNDALLEAFVLENTWWDPVTEAHLPFDADANGTISQGEALAVTGHIAMAQAGISNLSDLGFFKNLSSLSLAQISAPLLNLGEFASLQQLHLQAMPSLTTIVLPDQAVLQSFEVVDLPSLSSFLESGLPHLQHVRIDTTALTGGAFLQAGKDSLETLFLARSQLPSLAINGFPLLRSLRLEDNPNLAAIQIANLTHLEEIEVMRHPQLASLHLADLPNLAALQAWENPLLPGLTLAGLTNLTALAVRQNVQFNQLVLRNLPALTWVNAEQNDVESLIMQNLPALEGLQIRENAIPFLDLNSFPQLEFVDASANQLQMFPLLPNQVTSLHLAENQILDIPNLPLPSALTFAEFRRNHLLAIDSLPFNTTLLSEPADYLGLDENFLGDSACEAVEGFILRSRNSGALFTIANQQPPIPAWPNITILDILQMLDQPTTCLP